MQKAKAPRVKERAAAKIGTAPFPSGRWRRRIKGGVSLCKPNNVDTHAHLGAGTGERHMQILATLLLGS